MRILYFSCLIVATSCQYFHQQAIGQHQLHTNYQPHHQPHHQLHQQPQHQALPTYTPEDALARQQHFQAYALAAQRNGAMNHHHPSAHLGYNHYHPHDTPEIQQAKALHFAAHAKARGHYRRKRDQLYYGRQEEVPVISHDGVPLDTPEVQALKAEHFEAHAKALQQVRHQRPHQAFYQTNEYDNHNGYNKPVAVFY